MTSKIAAARLASGAGITLAIASGRVHRPLAALAQTGRCTLFPAEKSAPARKAWLAGGLRAAGEIHIDSGAVRALGQGKSLLAAGALQITGNFARGDLVVVIAPDGSTVARGLSEYDAGDAARLCGKRSDDHAAILGYAPRSALIHRNQMALL